MRKNTPALQRGVQVNVALSDDTAAFYRVLQADNVAQTALVLLNKGEKAASFDIAEYLQGGTWKEQLSGQQQNLKSGQSLQARVGANDVQVWVLEGEISQPELLKQVRSQMDRQ